MLVSLPEGSWGEGGFHWIWLNDKTSWIWSRIYELEREILAADGKWSSGQPFRNQTVEAFMPGKIFAGEFRLAFPDFYDDGGDYAGARASLHFERAMKILGWLEKTSGLTPEEYFWLEKVESEDYLFREVLLPNGNII
jgi:1,4-alpha-glucan branching enzyme